jgi:penicillin-binding protein 1A
MSSINTIAVKVYQNNPEYNWNFATKNLGLTIDPTLHHWSHLSNSLGVWESTALEMARAYSCFANNGTYNEIRTVTKIIDADGNVMMEPQPLSRVAMKETTAYGTYDLLRSVVTGGTATRARIGSWYIGGKTGTTNLDERKYRISSGNPDAWFVGITPVYTAAVWIGFDETDIANLQYLRGEYGGDKPTTIFRKVMTVALEDHPVQSSIPRPSGFHIPAAVFPKPPEDKDTKPTTPTTPTTPATE